MWSPKEWTKIPENWEACRGPKSDGIGEERAGGGRVLKEIWRGVKIEVKTEDDEYLQNHWTKSRRTQDLGSCTRLELVCAIWRRLKLGLGRWAHNLFKWQTGKAGIEPGAH